METEDECILSIVLRLARVKRILFE